MSQISVKYGDLSKILIGSNDKIKLYEYVKTTFGLNNESFELYSHEVDVFVKNHNFRWFKKSKGRQHHFETQYSSWLNQEFRLKKPSVLKRKLKPFNECSIRTKKRRMDDICQKTTREEIEGAFYKNLSESNKVDAEIISKLSVASLATKELILRCLNGDLVPFNSYTADEALALIVDLKLTKFQYDLLHIQAKNRNADMYPPYHHVLEAKKKCYPSGIELSDYGANIKLQSLVDITTTRIIQTCDPMLLETATAGTQLQIKYKWGLDGASKQSTFKQKFKDDDGKASDESVFMISLVPLQIKSNKTVIWKNPRPSSTNYCRPIRFDFMKENKDTTKQQFKLIQDQIFTLKSTLVDWNDKKLTIKSTLYSTMVDGKIINHLTDTSSTNCNICNAKPTEMNDHDLVRKKICDTDNYCFGLSTLHCWIRFFEACLHIAYKLKIERYRTSTAEENQIVEATKTAIQNIFKLEKGLNIDKVKNGPGNTNDGNTARAFFRDEDFAAKATGLNKNFIHRLHVILVALTNSNQIDTVKFEKYTKDTATLYNKHYIWYYMPPSLHKILFHGADIMDYFDLPIGNFSEEAQEARNKDFRRIRENNTRKNSRVNTNEDIIHWLLISSDPVISSLRTIFPKKVDDYHPDVVELFQKN